MAKAEYIRFTAARLRKLAPGDSLQTYKDRERPGLQLLVYPGGTKTFEIYAKPRGKRVPVRVKIGTFPAISLRDADEAASQIRALLKQGIDPNQKEKAERQKEDSKKLTLAQAFARYTEAKQLAPRTLDNYQRAINRDMADWKDRPLMDITREMVLTRFNYLDKETSKTAAQRMAQVLRAVWTFCNDLDDSGNMPYGICPVHILNRQKKGWAKTGKRVRRIRPEEMPAWLKAVRDEGGVMGAYLEFLLLTGCRRREATRLTWQQVTFRKGAFTFLATKNGTDHTLPMTQRVRDILKTRKQQSKDSPGPFWIDDPKKAIRRVMKASGTEFSSHDLRRTYITLADLSGAGQYAIKAITNHANTNDVTGLHYASYDDPRDLLEPMQKIENHILGLARVRLSVVAVNGQLKQSTERQ